jgi:hypothetical protein
MGVVAKGGTELKRSPERGATKRGGSLAKHNYKLARS